MAERYYRSQRVTTSTVIAGDTGANTGGKQCRLHTVTLNSVAATAVVTLYDYNSTTSPPASAIKGVWTGPAGGLAAPVSLIFDAEFDTGITVTIATAAADVTVTYL